jgi:hypothetical protein
MEEINEVDESRKSSNNAQLCAVKPKLIRGNRNLDVSKEDQLNSKSIDLPLEVKNLFRSLSIMLHNIFDNLECLQREFDESYY